MITAPPNLLDYQSTILIGNNAFQRHVTLDLCFHAVQHGAQIIVAADEAGDIVAFRNEYARWRASHKLPLSKSDGDVIGFTGAFTFTRHTDILDAVEKLTLQGERPLVIAREFNSYASIPERVNYWHGWADILLRKGSPFVFVSVASVGNEPFKIENYSAPETIVRVSYGFRLPPGILRAHENVELTLDYVKPQGRSLFVKGNGHPDIIFQYGTEVSDFVSPALA